MSEPNKGAAAPAASSPKPAPVLAAGKAAGADKPGLEMTRPYGYHLEPILSKIQATSDQKVKITMVVMSYRSTIEPLREQYRTKQQQFIDSMLSGGAAETMMAQQVELGNLSNRISSKYCLMRLEIRRLLNPQQILEFESYGREHGWNH